MKFSTSLSTLAALLIVTASYAGRGKLEVGEPAPGLDIEEWVKGGETSLESGRVYVVEFWATWCAPCRKSIPHLTKLQKQYGDDGLTIIGVSSEEPDTVKPFVTRQGDKMNYTIAVDRRSSTERAWMRAANLDGIPAAFIVDRTGKIVYIGNPLSEDFDPVLAKVMRGRYDPKLAKEAEPMFKAARSARKVRNWRMAQKHYTEIIVLNPRVFAEVGIEQFEMLLVDMQEPEQAYEFARTVLIGGLFADDPDALSMLARKIVTDPKIDPENRDMDVALAAAELARQQDSSPSVLATLAMVQYHRGEIEDAVKMQKRAYFTASTKQKTEYKRVLRTYQEASGSTNR